MIKHFESLWEDSERLSGANLSEVNVLDRLHELVDALYKDNADFDQLIGNLLYLISFISGHNKVNVYASLVNAMQQAQFESIGEDL